MSVETNPQAANPRTKTLRKVGLLTVVVILVVGLILAALTWIGFRSRAEGIATGYLQAASSAYQMGRPIPDTIFETGPYRVQALSTGGVAGAPLQITVFVKDRMFNVGFYEESRTVSAGQR